MTAVANVANETGRAVRPLPGSCTPRWSVHSSANQLRTNDDAPIRDGEHPPSFRSLASAQVSYIRCFFGAYYRYREPVKDRMDLTGARWGLSGAEALLRQGSGA